MITARQGVGLFFFISVSTAVLLFVMVSINSNEKRLPLFASTTASVTPIPIAPSPEQNPPSVMDSPEGSKTLTLESEVSGGTTSYSVLVSTQPENKKQQIFKKQEQKEITLSIPYNTWSPDTVYFFLKEEEGASMTDYLVFQSSGDSFPNETPYYSVQELFSKKVPNYVIEDVTGWGAPNLLIVNTKAVEGETRVSFWFEVSSQSFIQLSTYFK